MTTEQIPRKAITINYHDSSAIVKARIEQEPDGQHYWSVIAFMPYASCRTTRAHEEQGKSRFISMVVAALDVTPADADELKGKLDAAIDSLTDNFKLPAL